MIILAEYLKNKKEKLISQLLSIVQKMGLEPTQYCYHTDLNRTRLPIPPLLQTIDCSTHRIIVQGV